jgi:hypothetical protein
MADVFVSYKRDDQPRVAALVEAMRGAGIAVWWDQDIAPGSSWRETIAAELEQAKLCLVAWSEASVGAAGRFVREEAERAAGRGAYVGVLLDPVLPPFGFGEWQAVDLSGWDGSGDDPRIHSLIAQIESRLSGGPAPPAAEPAQIRRAKPRRPFRRRAAYGALLLLLLAGAAAGGLWLTYGRGERPTTPTAFVNARADAFPCTWVQISNVRPDASGEQIALAGISSAPESLQSALVTEARAQGVGIADVDVSDVAAGPPETCAELELLRLHRWQGRSRLSIAPTRGPLRQTEYGWSGRFEFEVDFTGLPPHSALLALDTAGGVEVLIPDLQEFRRRTEAAGVGNRNGPLRRNGNRFTYEGYFFDENEGARNVGLVLMTASRPIDAELVGAIGTRRDEPFLRQIERDERAGGWQFELALVRCGFEQNRERAC